MLVKMIICECINLENPRNSQSARIIEKLRNSHKEFLRLDDLCGTIVREPERLREWISDADELIVSACHPRAVCSLLSTAGICLPLRFYEDNLASLTSGLETHFPFSEGWRPWYPVIDEKPCTNCQQCLEFCLFGVFECDAGKVRVSHPENCKDNCPACARVCPAAAIIFPKHPDPAVHGELVSSADAGVQAVDLEELSAGDIYERLRRRNQQQKKKRQLFKPEIEQALFERDCCLDCSGNSGNDSSSKSGKLRSSKCGKSCC